LNGFQNALPARLLSRFILRLLGWTLEGPALPGGSYVLVGFPHTSNFDLLPGVLGPTAAGARLRFLAKSTLFTGAKRPLMKLLGGVPVDRGGKAQTVNAAVALLSGPRPVALGILPKGTRGLRTGWRSGFLHVARLSGVPVVLCGLDYGQKRLIFSEALDPNDLPRLMNEARTLAAQCSGRHPEQDDSPSLQEEQVRPAGADESFSSVQIDLPAL